MKQQQNQGQGRRQKGGSRGAQSDPIKSMVLSAAGRYARALINKDELTINAMTLYTTGGVGGSPKSLTALEKSGAQNVLSVQAHTKGQKSATVLFGTNGSISCIGLFNVIDGGHVFSDWQIFIPA